MSDSNDLVVQSRHVVNAAYRLDLQPKRLLMLAISKVNPLDPWVSGEKLEFRITANDWRETYGFKKHKAYETLKEGAYELMRAPIIKLKTGLKSHLEFPWVQSCFYEKGEGFVDVQFSDKAKFYISGDLSGTGGFVSHKLLAVNKIKSPTAIELYQFLIRFKNSSQVITVDELRERLLMEDKYPLYREFNKSVILKAIAEINKHSDQNVYVQPHETRGRKVVSLKFFVTDKIK